MPKLWFLEWGLEKALRGKMKTPSSFSFSFSFSSPILSFSLGRVRRSTDFHSPGDGMHSAQHNVGVFESTKNGRQNYRSLASLGGAVLVSFDIFFTPFALFGHRVLCIRSSSTWCFRGSWHLIHCCCLVVFSFSRLPAVFLYHRRILSCLIHSILDELVARRIFAAGESDFSVISAT